MSKYLMSTPWKKHRGARGRGFWQCPYCRLLFDTRVEVREHVATTHSVSERREIRARGEGAFSGKGRACHVCFRRFKDSNALNRHKNAYNHFHGSHHGCEYCGRRFDTSALLTRHMDAEHFGPHYVSESLVYPNSSVVDGPMVPPIPPSAQPIKVSAVTIGRYFADYRHYIGRYNRPIICFADMTFYKYRYQPIEEKIPIGRPLIPPNILLHPPPHPCFLDCRGKRLQQKGRGCAKVLARGVSAENIRATLRRRLATNS